MGNYITDTNKEYILGATEQELIYIADALGQAADLNYGRGEVSTDRKYTAYKLLARQIIDILRAS